MPAGKVAFNSETQIRPSKSRGRFRYWLPARLGCVGPSPATITAVRFTASTSYDLIRSFYCGCAVTWCWIFSIGYLLSRNVPRSRKQSLHRMQTSCQAMMRGPLSIQQTNRPACGRFRYWLPTGPACSRCRPATIQKPVVLSLHEEQCFAQCECDGAGEASLASSQGQYPRSQPPFGVGWLCLVAKDSIGADTVSTDLWFQMGKGEMVKKSSVGGEQ